MNFEELEKIELQKEEEAAFRRISTNADFKILSDYIEKKILKMTYSLATGSFAEGQSKEEYLNELRGFARNWKKIKSSIYFKEQT